MTVRARTGWDQKSPDEYRELQIKRLRSFLSRQVLPFSPYYRKLFDEAGLTADSIRSHDDLEKIPFTTKDTICPTEEDPDRPRQIFLHPSPELIRKHWPLSAKLPLALKKIFRGEQAVRDQLAHEYRPVSIFFTTGRTSLPTAFLLTRYDLGMLEEAGRRIVEVTGIDAQSQKAVNLFPYAPHLAFWQVYYVGLGGGVFTLNTGGGKVMGTDGILQSIQKIKPAFLVGIPGYVYHLLREAHSRGLDFSFVKALALGGDAVTPGYRNRVKELLVSMGADSPKVASVLGFTEARKCWTECEGEGEAGFHTYPDMEIIECLDPETGKPVPEGETGELVYTSIDGRGSCVLRYRTGDLLIGGITWKQCPHCGRRVMRMSSQLERVSNMKNFQLSKVKGTLINLNQFKELLDNDDRVEEWQLVIKKRNDDPFDVDELHLNYALADKAASQSSAEIASALQKKIFEITEVNLNSTNALPLPEVLELLGMETQMKEKRIVDLRATNHETAETAVAEEAAKK